jgi:3-hydroxybutyryl-CoA dehydrogenase
MAHPGTSRAMLTAAISLVANGVSTPEDVDRTYMITNRGCAMGPCGLLDMVGMKTAYDVSSYWGTLYDDAQMLKNAAYAAPDFLAVPDASVVPSLVDRMLLRSG